jgi:hypothetical protein
MGQLVENAGRNRKETNKIGYISNNGISTLV